MPFAQLHLETAISQVLRCRAGEEYQSTAQGILRHLIPGFQAILPYGRDGDGGNDGYSRSRGVYTQIFAPRSAHQPMRGAARKAERDFAKIRKKWRGIGDVKEYWFVSNSPGSNIHVENALSHIGRKYGVKTRFVGSTELAEEAATLPASTLEQLMGFQIRAEPMRTSRGSGELTLLSTLDSQWLDALHLLAALGHPVPPKLCHELLPEVADWTAFFKWLIDHGWAVDKNKLVELDEKVACECRKNRVAQKRACQTWVPVLVGYGSVDCLYLALLPLSKLGRMGQALRTFTRVALDFADSGWDAALVAVADAFNKTELLSRLKPQQTLSFQLARAALLARTGKDHDALALYQCHLRAAPAWPRGLSKALITLNCGVCAYRVGDESLAKHCYSDAMRLARNRKDDLIWGRAATNLAQMIMAANPERANALVNQAETAKKRVADLEGLVVTSMVRGLIAGNQGEHGRANAQFNAAARQARAIGYRDVLADVYYNAGKSCGEMGRWHEAATQYGRSLREADRRSDRYNAARAQLGLAEAWFHSGKCKQCEEACTELARLPKEERWSEFRLAGMHGLIVLALRTSEASQGGHLVRKAVRFARSTGRDAWIGRIVVDVAFGRARNAPTPRELQRLLDRAVREQKAGRPGAARRIYNCVWQHCASVHTPWAEAIRDEAETLLDELASAGATPAEMAKYHGWKASILLNAGYSWRAVETLAAYARYARQAERWAECAAATDEQAVALQELGRPDAAAPLHRQAMAIASANNLPRQHRISAVNLAECLRRLGRLRSALRISHRALRLHNAESPVDGYISNLHNHHLIERGLGRHAAAATTLRRCETLAARHGVAAERVRAIMARGNAAVDRGEHARAERTFRKALRLATRAKMDSRADDCRYNLALVLRTRGKPRAAIHLLRQCSKAPRASTWDMHRTVLLALLFEDAGDLQGAGGAWKRAALTADRLRAPGHYAYHMTRADLLSRMPDQHPSIRKSIADRANALYASVCRAPDSDKALQRRFDKADVFLTEQRLTAYRVQLLRDVAERLSRRHEWKDLVSAAQASVASVIASVDAGILGAGMEWHVGWLVRLRLSKSRLLALRNATRKWLFRQFHSFRAERVIERLLVGFDTLITNSEIMAAAG